MTLFDEFFDRGRAAVLAGDISTNTPPVDGGASWGLTVMLTPDATLAARYAEVAAEAMELAGAAQLPTGQLGRAHFTIRCLDQYALAPDPDFVARVSAALHRAYAAVRPAFRLAVTGLTLTPGGVMACAEPLDDAPDQFRKALGAELGSDGFYEFDFDRNIWYSNLVHFAAPIARPAELVDWVADRRRLHLGGMVRSEVELIRWEYDGVGMTPVLLEAVS